MTKDTPVPQPEIPRKTVTFCNTVQVRKFKIPPLPTRKARNGKRYIPEDALDAKCEDIITDGTQPIHDPDRMPKKVYQKEKMMVPSKDKGHKEEVPCNEECCVNKGNGDVLDFNPDENSSIHPLL